MVKVYVNWRGATPQEIEDNIATVVERRMATVDGLDYMESQCTEGMYALQVNFDYSVDRDVAYQDVLAKMGLVKRLLPKDADEPYMMKADPSQLPVVAGTPIGVTVMIGIVALAGIEVYHGVVLLTLVNQLREEGQPPLQAVIQSGATRLRPILMTLFVGVVGLLPLALGLGEGTETLQPMAIGVIGGLLFSLLLTLFFLPALYISIFGAKQ